MVTAVRYPPGPQSRLPGGQMLALVLRRSVCLWGLSAHMHQANKRMPWKLGVI